MRVLWIVAGEWGLVAVESAAQVAQKSIYKRLKIVSTQSISQALNNNFIIFPQYPFCIPRSQGHKQSHTMQSAIFTLVNNGNCGCAGQTTCPCGQDCTCENCPVHVSTMFLQTTHS